MAPNTQKIFSLQITDVNQRLQGQTDEQGKPNFGCSISLCSADSSDSQQPDLKNHCSKHKIEKEP